MYHMGTIESIEWLEGAVRERLLAVAFDFLNEYS